MSTRYHIVVTRAVMASNMDQGDKVPIRDRHAGRDDSEDNLRRRHTGDIHFSHTLSLT
jgi:hypothetical protein